MANDNEKVTLNIPILEILLVIGIIITIIGIIAPIQLIEIFGFKLWLNPDLWILCIPGMALVWGYITKKILPNKKGAYWIGFFLGIIGLIVSICIRPTNDNVNKSNSSSSKYEDLQKLAELKQSGILTEEEFKAQKERILK